LSARSSTRYKIRRGRRESEHGSRRCNSVDAFRPRRAPQTSTACPPMLQGACSSSDRRLSHRPHLRKGHRVRESLPRPGRNARATSIHERVPAPPGEAPLVSTDIRRHHLGSGGPGSGFPAQPQLTHNVQRRGGAVMEALFPTKASTCTVTGTSSVILNTRQDFPRRCIVSPIAGSAFRLRSYSKSPFGKWITNALAGMRNPPGCRLPTACRPETSLNQPSRTVGPPCGCKRRSGQAALAFPSDDVKVRFL
jgi:hypothetical protein